MVKGLHENAISRLCRDACALYLAKNFTGPHLIFSHQDLSESTLWLSASGAKGRHTEQGGNARCASQRSASAWNLVLLFDFGLFDDLLVTAWR